MQCCHYATVKKKKTKSFALNTRSCLLPETAARSSWNRLNRKSTWAGKIAAWTAPRCTGTLSAPTHGRDYDLESTSSSNTPNHASREAAEEQGQLFVWIMCKLKQRSEMIGNGRLFQRLRRCPRCQRVGFWSSRGLSRWRGRWSTHSCRTTVTHTRNVSVAGGLGCAVPVIVPVIF